MPGDPEPLLGLLRVYEARQDYPALAGQLEAILRIMPDNALLRDRLTRVYAELGEIPHAMEHSRNLISSGLSTPSVHSFYAYYHLFLPDRTRAAQRDTCQGVFSSSAQAQRRPLPSEPRRKLRIGYLTGDFCSGPPFYFLSSLFAHHSLDRFAIFCYNTRPSVDNASEWYRSRFHWRDCSLLNDSDLAEAISADRIDILVDLSGIMPGNRLSVFALRPAPIQATYPNCPSTTGASGIDYIMTDRTVCPPGHEDNYTETPVFLDSGYLAFSPDPAAPPLTPLPALSNGFITFGLFQQLAKLNTAVWDSVARILHACPNSQLLLHNSSHGFTGPAAPNCRLAFRQLADRGVPADRVRIGPQCSHSGSMALMAQADIALDSFPFQGQTTTCDCLWMGVPVVALTGHNHAARVSTSLLENARLPQFAATTADHYVHTALRLAAAVPQLAALRAGLRSHLLTSPLLDARRLASQVERAYRRMWRSGRSKTPNLKGISTAPCPLKNPSDPFSPLKLYPLGGTSLPNLSRASTSTVVQPTGSSHPDGTKPARNSTTALGSRTRSFASAVYFGPFISPPIKCGSGPAFLP